jgi:hypothetical protein
VAVLQCLLGVPEVDEQQREAARHRHPRSKTHDPHSRPTDVERVVDAESGLPGGDHFAGVLHRSPPNHARGAEPAGDIADRPRQA